MPFATSTDVFTKMLKIQLIAITILAIILFFMFGAQYATSALLGGFAVIVGSFFASLISKKSIDQQNASAVLINLLKAEAVKIVTIVFLLFLAFKFYLHLIPFALIGGLAVTAIFSGAALSKLNV